MSAPPRIVFCDVESTGLDPATHDVWEVALIERHPESVQDIEHHWFIKPKRLQLADPNALQINRFYERTRNFHDATDNTRDPAAAISPGSPDLQRWTGCQTAARKIALVTAGAVIVGSNPGFDMSMLDSLLRSNGLMPAWHYRPIDVATLAYGYELGAAAVEVEEGEVPALVAEVAHPRISSQHLASKQSIPKPEGPSAHTAMADARWARNWYDALIGGKA